MAGVLEAARRAGLPGAGTSGCTLRRLLYKSKLPRGSRPEPIDLRRREWAGCEIPSWLSLDPVIAEYCGAQCAGPVSAQRHGGWITHNPCPRRAFGFFSVRSWLL